MEIHPLGDDGQRLSPIYPYDHAGYLWIAAILALVYSLMAAGGRAWVKWGAYAADDYLLGLATAAELGQSASLMFSLKNGLARFNSMTNEGSWLLSSKSFFVSQLLSVLVLCLAKCSVTWLFLRLISDTGQSLTVPNAVLFLNILWGVAAIAGLSVDCNANTILTTDNITQCPKQFLRWQIITAVDIITDVAACLAPLVLVWSLRMSFNVKFKVVTAFAFRAPLVVFSAFHLASMNDYLGSAEPQFAVWTAVLFQQVIVGWSLISATIPNLSSFMRSFSMGLGMPVVREGDTRSAHDAYALQTIGGSTVAGRPRETRGPSPKRTVPSDLEDERDDDVHDALRPDVARHQAIISHSDHCSDAMEGRSLSRCGSRELIIRKEIGWSVSEDTP